MFDIFDQNNSGELDYLEFVAALRPERQVNFSIGGIITSFLVLIARSKYTFVDISKKTYNCKISLESNCYVNWAVSHFE